MKIYLYLNDKIIKFNLPLQIIGSFSFDEFNDESTKLINIEAKNNNWYLYATDDVKIISNGNSVNELPLVENEFYVLRRNKKEYLMSTAPINDKSFKLYSYDKNIDLQIGNSDSLNFRYNINFINSLAFKIYINHDRIILEKENYPLYINNKIIINRTHYIKIGDELTFYGLHMIFLSDFVLINNPDNKINILATTNLKLYDIPTGDAYKTIEISDEDLYQKEDYFFKAPRIRRTIEPKIIDLDAPPRKDENNAMPLILTLGPMLTMGLMSLVMLINIIDSLYTKETIIEKAWPQLITSIIMLATTLLWPLITNYYNKKIQAKKEKITISKYNQYLKGKKQELMKEKELQSEILKENLISIEECLNIIKTRNINFWEKRIDQNDFLVARVGHGNELLNAKINFPKEGFTIEENELRIQSEKLIKDCKYIENVPIGYSFYQNKVTAIMGNLIKSVYFTNNILLQLLTFYSYEDLKLVVFTSKDNEENWDYIKYLNHNFNNSKTFRFFSSDIETAKTLAEVLNQEVTNRLSMANEKKIAFFKPYYLIIIDDYDLVKRYSFIKTLTETELNIGFSIIITENKLSSLPSKCSNFIFLKDNASIIIKNSYEKQEKQIFYDEVNYTLNMMNISRILANIPIEFEETAKSLPDAISFLEMENIGKVEQLNILNRWHINDPTKSLKAEIGIDEQNELMYLDLHEKFHGPHGLIAGMTGSGKSEFIITYILSMAINYSPDDVSFVLIDYKGGGLAFAFENKLTKMRLPHLAGTITNLDKAEMDRTLVSIESEVKRRQNEFNTVRDSLGESTIDIYKYQKLYKEGKIANPIPHLFIICDEFAELKTQQPDFMDNLISIARIGRSLGIHLILATQKPSGIVNAQIWSNSKFHICLKVQDAADSNEMLKKPDAANLKQTGRFYMQVGYDEFFALGQSAWCGAKYFPSDKIAKQIDKSISIVDDNALITKNIESATKKVIETGGEQISAIMEEIIKASNKTAKRSKQLWLENIPAIITTPTLINKYQYQKNPQNMEIIIGEYDAPEEQRQGLLTYNFLTDGNTAIYGNDSSETDMLLNIIVYNSIKNYTPREINFYIIDYGSQSLRKFENAPHIGGIVLQSEDEEYFNCLKLIKEEIKRRKEILADFGGNYLNYISSNKGELPLKVIIINNYDSVKETDTNLYETMPELVRDSERYGIIFILTATGITSISTKVLQSVLNKYTFKLKDPSDYLTVFNCKKNLLPRDIIGRGVFKENDVLHEFQTASIIEDESKLNEFINEEIKLINANSKEKAFKIPVLPDQVTYDLIKDNIKNISEVPIGITKKDLKISTIDLTNRIGTIITSNKLEYMNNFARSFIQVLATIPDTRIIIIDPEKELGYPPNTKNYYTEKMLDVINALINYLNKEINQNSKTNSIIIFYSFDNILTKIDDISKFEVLINLLKKLENKSIIIFDDFIRIKKYTMENWFRDYFSTRDGLFIGKGAGEQNLLKITTYSKILNEEYKNNMGFNIMKASYDLIKLIEFEKNDEDDE